MTQADIVTPAALKYTDEVTCTLPWYLHRSEYW